MLELNTDKYKNVYVIGDCIRDIYKFVTVNPAISNKNFCLSTTHVDGDLESHDGGTKAIYENVISLLKDFTNRSELNVKYYHSNNIVEKIRFVEKTKNQTLFEMQQLTDSFSVGIPQFDEMKNSIILLCDFGHGYFDNRMLFDIFHNLDFDTNYVALMCQTNSSNYGFNTFRKWINLSTFLNEDNETICPFDFVSCNLQEARLAFPLQKDINVTELVELIQHFLCNRKDRTTTTILTNKKNGLYISYEGNVLNHFQFNKDQSKVVDATGCGDIVFLLGTLLQSILYRERSVDTLCSYIEKGAYWKTQHLGNKKLITISDIL